MTTETDQQIENRDHRDASEVLFETLKKGAPSGVITRKKITELTDGLVKVQWLSNLDCAGKGIEGRMMIGKQIVYPVDNVIDFLNKTIIKAV